MVRFFGLNKKKNEEKENTDLPADNEQNAAETSSSNVSGNEERIDPNSHDTNPENANNDDASTTFGSSIQSSSIFSRGRMTYGTGASSSMATSEMRSHRADIVDLRIVKIYRVSKMLGNH